MDPEDTGIKATMKQLDKYSSYSQGLAWRQNGGGGGRTSLVTTNTGSTPH